MSDQTIWQHIRRGTDEYGWCPDGDEGECDFCNEMALLRRAADEGQRLLDRVAELEALIDAYVHASAAWNEAMADAIINGDEVPVNAGRAVQDAVQALKADTRRREGR